jgi:hypothetical protein
MKTRHFCTYFDHHYLPRGIVLLESLHLHYPKAYIHVLCLSDRCRAAMEKLSLYFVHPISLHELEKVDIELFKVRPTRRLHEYYFTITPCLLRNLLTEGDDIDEITYLDADMMFFSSPEPLFDEDETASVIITPHRFPQSYNDLERYGKYNISWLTFRNSVDGLECLEWYRKSCLEWCYDTVEETRFADQKYLDVFPEKFSGVHVMRHQGGGVAPWNVRDSFFTRSRNAVIVNGEPLIFYHAHMLKHILGPFYMSGFHDIYGVNLDNPVVKYIITTYVHAYEKAIKTAKYLVTGTNFSGIRRNTANMSLIDKINTIYEEAMKKTLVCSYL